MGIDRAERRCDTGITHQEHDYKRQDDADNRGNEPYDVSYGREWLLPDPRGDLGQRREHQDEHGRGEDIDEYVWKTCGVREDVLWAGSDAAGGRLDEPREQPAHEQHP